MQLGRHLEVEAIVLTARDPAQKLDRLLTPMLIITQCLRAADGEIAHSARERD
jgi:hypothetical protein